VGKIKIDAELCIGCGVCVDICPEMFTMDEAEGKAVVKDNAACTGGCCKEAADSCPTEAIIIE